MKKIKVLFIVNHDIVIYNFRKEIVERMLDEGYEVSIASPYGERIDELVNMGCEYIEMNMDRHGTNFINDSRLIRNYDKIFNSVKPNVILGFTIKPNIYGAFVAKKYNIPFIANITGLGTAVENGGFLQMITVLLYKIAFNKVQTVFFQNNENRQFFVDKKIALGKHKLLPGSGVNLTYFKLLNYPGADTIKFVFISRIMKQKGIDQYLEAAEQVKKQFPNTEFHVCGFCEEEYEDKLKDLANRGIIVYHGMVRDIRKILVDMHCTVHPTFYPEGLSNVLLESAASGRPIITTDRSGTREVVEDGVTGYLIKQKDTSDLIEKITKFITLPYTEKIEFGMNGRKKVEEEYNREIIVNAYLNEIKNI